MPRKKPPTRKPPVSRMPRRPAYGVADSAIASLNFRLAGVRLTDQQKAWLLAIVQTH